MGAGPAAISAIAYAIGIHSNLLVGIRLPASSVRCAGLPCQAAAITSSSLAHISSRAAQANQRWKGRQQGNLVSWHKDRISGREDRCGARTTQADHLRLLRAQVTNALARQRILRRQHMFIERIETSGPGERMADAANLCCRRQRGTG